jgi:hypothetical protein
MQSRVGPTLLTLSLHSSTIPSMIHSTCARHCFQNTDKSRDVKKLYYSRPENWRDEVAPVQNKCSQKPLPGKSWRWEARCTSYFKLCSLTFVCLSAPLVVEQVDCEGERRNTAHGIVAHLLSYRHVKGASQQSTLKGEPQACGKHCVHVHWRDAYRDAGISVDTLKFRPKLLTEIWSIHWSFRLWTQSM